MHRVVNINGRTFSFYDSGKGIPVILLHGYLETAEVFEKISTLLSVNFRVISVDLPGHGSSDIVAEVQKMELMAESVNDLLGFLDIDKCFLAGHSMGGYVTLAFLEMYPEKLLGYSLLHSHPYPDTSQALLKRQTEIDLTLQDKADLFIASDINGMYSPVNLSAFADDVKRSLRIACTVSRETVVSVLKGMMERPSRVKIMQKGIVPCLWILGRNDNYIPPERIEGDDWNIPGMEIEFLEHSGHMGFVEEPESSVKLLTDFVRRYT